MRRAVQYHKVTRAMLIDVGMPDLPLPPVEWFVRGPRGGIYLATGERVREVFEDSDDFIRCTMTVMDRSEGVRYVRPGSALFRRATEHLPDSMAAKPE